MTDHDAPEPQPYEGPGTPGGTEQQQPRFPGWSVVGGIALSLVIMVVWLPLSLVGAGAITGYSAGNAAVLAFLLLLLVPLVPAVVLVRGRTPHRRGLGLGLLMGWGLIAIVSGGVCINLVHVF